MTQPDGSTAIDNVPAVYIKDKCASKFKFLLKVASNMSFIRYASENSVAGNWKFN